MNQLAFTRKRMKSYHDKKILKREFKLNYLVLLFNSKLMLFPRKLKSKWSRPFIVKTVKPFGVVEIEDPMTKKSWLVNRQILKEYQGVDFVRLTTKTVYDT